LRSRAPHVNLPDEFTVLASPALPALARRAPRFVTIALPSHLARNGNAPHAKETRP
jgi:hypothetical protein